MNVDALKNFIIGQGASRRVITMEWCVRTCVCLGGGGDGVCVCVCV